MSRIPKFTSGNSQTDEVPDIPRIQKRAMNHMRRSKSFTDLKSASRLFTTASSLSVKNPPLKPPLISKKPENGTAVKAINFNSKLKANVNIPKLNNQKATTVPKAGIKRAAECSETEVKNKVVRKGVRVPEWDYKTRFGILNEKYMTLLNDYKGLQEKISESSEIASRNVELINNISYLEGENNSKELKINNLIMKIDELQKSLQNAQKHRMESEEDLKASKEKIKSLEELNEQLRKTNDEFEMKFQKATFDTDCVRKELDILTDKHQECCLQLKEVIQEKGNLKDEIFNAEKLRRKLHNHIQDIKGNIRVFSRLRPPLTEQEKFYQSNFNFVSDKTVEISRSRGSILPGGTMRGPEKHEFTFDKVFDQSTRQEEIFEELSQLIQSALDGYHVCVFAYGQTGSGKTHTMQGGFDPEEQGMIPRSVELIFNTKEQMEKKGWSYKISASFLEIYNENIQDLLDMKSGKSLEIRFNEGKGTTVTNLTMLAISSADELFKNMMIAQENRATAVTNFNEHSSRSHAVTKIYIEARYQQTKACFVGSVSLVDLAGSESAKSSSDERLTETKNINKSLSCLGTVMLALHKKDSHIPFRNSKLTYLLQSSLGGNCKCLMIVNISPNEDSFNETINALRFAAKVKEVKTVTSKNKLAN